MRSFISLLVVIGMIIAGMGPREAQTEIPESYKLYIPENNPFALAFEAVRDQFEVNDVGKSNVTYNNYKNRNTLILAGPANKSTGGDSGDSVFD